MVRKLQGKLDYIKKAVAEGKYRYTLHGAKQRIARRFKRKDIEEAVKSGEIIEDYPEHHYGPACLLLGKTPDLEEWEEDLKTRRKL